MFFHFAFFRTLTGTKISAIPAGACEDLKFLRTLYVPPGETPNIPPACSQKSHFQVISLPMNHAKTFLCQRSNNKIKPIVRLQLWSYVHLFIQYSMKYNSHNNNWIMITHLLNIFWFTHCLYSHYTWNILEPNADTFCAVWHCSMLFSTFLHDTAELLHSFSTNSENTGSVSGSHFKVNCCRSRTVTNTDVCHFNKWCCLTCQKDWCAL